VTSALTCQSSGVKNAPDPGPKLECLPTLSDALSTSEAASDSVPVVWTVTVVLCVAVPPAPVQVSVKVVLVERAPVDCVPETPFVPDQLEFAGVAEALHESAFVELQERVDA